LYVALLFLACSQRIADPVGESDLSFVILTCEEAEEFFQQEEDALTKPSGYSGYYACACPDKALGYVPIAFTLPEAMWYSLTIKNATGYHLRKYEGQSVAGLNVITWDTKTDKGNTVKSGIYIAALRTEIGMKADIFMILK
jgi:hypothetical protein